MLLTIVLAAGLAQAATPRRGLDVASGDQRVWQLQEAERIREDAVTVASRAPVTADGVRALLQLNRVDDALDALMRVVNEQPREAAGALRSLGSGTHFSDGARDYSPKLTAIFTAAHAQAARLPREDAAVLEFALVDAEGVLHRGSAPWLARATAVAERYEGTHAAALARVRLLVYRDMSGRLDALDAIVREHPGTDVAGAALYQKGFDLAVNAFVTGKDRQPDPTDRFMRVLAIARELESGAYPKGDWVDKAPQLVIGFNSYKPEYTPEHVDQMIGAYREFLKSHFVLEPVNPLGNGYGYFVNGRMADLFKVKGDTDGVDRTLRELEVDSPDREGAGYLRAVRAPAGAVRAGMLDAIASNPQNAYASKALATLALDELQAGHSAAARARFLRFVERYPGSEYAWIASLHAAEAAAVSGDWAIAEREFITAATTHASTRMAVVLGQVLAGHAAEAAGQMARAVDHYAAALDAWNRDVYEVSLYTTRTTPVFGRTDLTRRTRTLRASLSRPGGDLLERGRWQLENGQSDAAIVMLDEAVTRFPRSPVHADALLLLHRARLEAALDLADIERPDRNAAAAAARIDELSQQPLDSATVAARIAHASQLWSQGKPEQARDVMASAFGDWIKAQSHQAPNGDLEQDLAAIRDAVFRPLGDGIFAGRSQWNAFTWPQTLPRFLLVDPEIAVKLPSGDETSVVVTNPLPGLSNVVFSDKTMLDLLMRTFVALGGTKRRQPGAIVETPNQPVGDVGESMNILALWNEFFPARPGPGFAFTSYPRLTRVEFLDAARTRAAASVTIGYSGVTVVLEKRDGVWTPVRLTNEWIT
jgi:tetratricopeptide (TPR) repeat protein